MTDWIIAVVLLIIVGAAIAYIAKEKKKGVKCIGCPDAGHCSAKNSSGCGCHSKV